MSYFLPDGYRQQNRRHSIRLAGPVPEQQPSNNRRRLSSTCDDRYALELAIINAQRAIVQRDTALTIQRIRSLSPRPPSPSQLAQAALARAAHERQLAHESELAHQREVEDRLRLQQAVNAAYARGQAASAQHHHHHHYNQPQPSPPPPAHRAQVPTSYSRLHTRVYQ